MNMEKLENPVVFDLNGTIGQPVFDPESGRFTGYTDREKLLRNMGYYGVDYALVSHFRALKGDIMGMNVSLSEEIDESDRLFACWHLLPCSTGDVPCGRKLSELLKEHGIRAVRIPFADYNVCFIEELLEDLLRILEEERILTILQFPYMGVPVPDRDDAYMDVLLSVCRNYPSLPIVCAGRLRGLYYLLEKCPNLHLSLEWDPHPGIVEEVCRRFGPHRLLFGTPYSENAKEVSAMPLMMVTYADIMKSDKLSILGGNLAGLLGFDCKPREGVPGKTIFRKILAGEPLDYNIIDIHTHIGPFPWEYKPSTDAESLIGCMQRIGVSRACINATEAVTGGNHYEGNREIINLVQRYPDSFIGLLVFNPNFTDGEEYVNTCIHKYGFRGIKIHPRVHGCAITDNKYTPVWAASETNRIPVLCHTGQGQPFSEPAQFESIVPAYPHGLFILGHTGETFTGMQACIKLANAYPNVYLDLSGWCFMKKGFLEYLVTRVNIEQIVFGSDYSWIDLPYAVAAVACADISEREKRMILSENASRLLEMRRCR